MRKAAQCVLALAFCTLLTGANGGRTERFIVNGTYHEATIEPDAAVADAMTERFNQQLARMFENELAENAKFWTDERLPPWTGPCVVRAEVGPDCGAGGQTSFTFDRGGVYRWESLVVARSGLMGSSVVPHETSHMVFASFCRCPLPRWMDEGAAMFREPGTERVKLAHLLQAADQREALMSYKDVFFKMEYEKENENNLVLYAHAMIMSDCLIEIGGPKRYFKFVRAGCADKKWDDALLREYGLTLDRFEAICLEREMRILMTPRTELLKLVSSEPVLKPNRVSPSGSKRQTVFQRIRRGRR